MFVKIIKRIVVALVLCLAVVGGYALLKKAPQLNVPSEDIGYLEEIGISASESATDEGLSGAHGLVQGVPPLVSPSQIQGSNVPPGSFGIPTSLSSPAPLPLTGSETPGLTPEPQTPPFTATSEAPPFTATSEAPPFTATSEAPTFIATSEAPTFTATSEAPPFVAAYSEPVIASPFAIPDPAQTIPTSSAPSQPVPIQQVPFLPVPNQQVPILPVPNQQVPVSSLPNQQVPNQPISNQQVPVSSLPNQQVPVSSLPNQQVPVPSLPNQQVPVPSLPNQQVPVSSLPNQQVPISSIPNQTVPLQSVPIVPMLPLQTPIPPPSPPPDKSITWDGPITEVVFVPSAEISDSWKGLGVVEHPAESLESLPKPVDPFLASVVSAPVSPPFTTQLAHTEQRTVLPNNTGKVIVSGNRVKRLPVVTEEPQKIKQTATTSTTPVTSVDFEKNTALFAASVPTNSSKRLYPQTSPLPEEKYSPFKLNDYRQTSIHTDITFAPVLPLGNEEQPMISFVPQKNEKVEKNNAKDIIPVTTVLPVEPERPTVLSETEGQLTNTKSLVTETKVIDAIPFVAVDSSPVSPTTEISEQQTVTVIRETVERFIKAQTVLIESGDTTKIRNAFVQLSRLYEHQELNAAEKAYMMPLLDRLALNVIYSRNAHILELPYVIRLGDSVDSIAQTFNLSPALLMKINGLTGARPLEPGTELKVVVGHFDAKISAEHRELTLILGGLYAGRFPVALGERIEHLRGEFYIISKTDTWNEKSLTLNNGVVLYGTDRPQPGDPLATTVRFTQKDAKELFDILTEHSVIVFED
ncbi:MAG: LysM peptidoglycan-binding domain-containing protein [Planctomycetaceae bacterium]|nr:LysM peptidoglycan-binding domain-containing protein [Planctomycetaceae bacterium]